MIHITCFSSFSVTLRGLFRFLLMQTKQSRFHVFIYVPSSHLVGRIFFLKWLQESLTDCPELSADKQLFIQTCICQTTTRFFPHFLPGSGERWNGRDQLYFWQSSCSRRVFCFSEIQNTLFQHPADVHCVSEVLQNSPRSSSLSSCYFGHDC